MSHQGQFPPTRRRFHSTLTLAWIALAGFGIVPHDATAQSCAGDCNGDRMVSVDEAVLDVGIALGNQPLSRCEAADSNRDGQLFVDELVAITNRLLHGCPQRLAFISANLFPEGGFATVTLDEPRQVQPATSQRQIHNDAVPRVFLGLVYLVNRFDGDSIRVLDPEDDFATLSNCTTGGGSNPHDIAVLNANKAYVTLYGESDLLLVNPTPKADCTDFLLGRIDLSSFADEDGIPEMDQMAIVDGLLYVAIQRLLDFAPAGPGALIVIDTATDQVVDEIELTGQQPFSSTKGLVVRDGKIVVGQVGNFGATDGGIETVDLQTRNAEGFLITEEELGGDLNDFVLVSDTLAYALVSAPDFTTSLVRFDPTRGIVAGVLLSGAEFLSDLELNDRNEMFVSDRSFSTPGIRIFRASTGEELTAEPIDVGLPPFEIVFLR